MATSRPVLWALLFSACASAPPVPSGPALLVPLEEGMPLTHEELVSRHEATVFVWWSTSCPCAGRYEKRLLDLRSRHDEKTLGIYAVVSGSDETRAGVRAEAARRGFTLPLFFDPGGEFAQALRVRSTPSVVLFDRSLQVRFTGWMDNEREPGERGRKPWLDEAIDGVLSGTSDFQKKSPTWGCPITRSLFDELPECCRAPAVSE